MKDEDLMPFGKFKGKKMIEVPDSYLKWFWMENAAAYHGLGDELSYSAKRVMGYIEDCFSSNELQ